MGRIVKVSLLGREVEEYCGFNIEPAEVLCKDTGVVRHEFAVWRDDGDDFRIYWCCPTKEEARASIDWHNSRDS